MNLTVAPIKSLLFMCFFVFVIQEQLSAQMVIGAPNLGFSQACANKSFNDYSTTFVFSPDTAVEASNQFIIEMSDAMGDFTNASIVFTSAAGSVTSSPATLNFSIPETTAGENYRIRIRSTAPAVTSSRSAEFSAYYKIQDSPFTINNLVSTGAYCSGGSYLLTIDDPGTESNDSPRSYPSLTFYWYRETSPTTSVFVEEGPELIVSTEGTYFVETNYGTCTSNSFSNRVTISEAISGEANATIASSLGNPYCPEQGLTTLSTIGGNSYQWFKDGVAIADATNQMYQTNESGIFSVEVDLGNCKAAGSIDLMSELFDSSINVDDINTMEEGETLSVTVTNTAENPEFQWYFNDILLTDETSQTFIASDYGNYRVVVSETGTTGCNGSIEYSFSIQEDVQQIPNVISPNGDNINDTWVIPQQYGSGTDTEVMIITNRGKVVFKSNDYQNNWPEADLRLTNINQVYYYIITTSDNSIKKGSITVVK